MPIFYIHSHYLDSYFHCLLHSNALNCIMSHMHVIDMETIAWDHLIICDTFAWPQKHLYSWQIYLNPHLDPCKKDMSVAVIKDVAQDKIVIDVSLQLTLQVQFPLSIAKKRSIIYIASLLIKELLSNFKM